MRKLYLILILVLAFFSLSFAQSYTTATVDSGLVISDTLTIPTGNVVYSLIIPANLSDSINIYVGYKEDGDLYQLYNEDGTAYLIVGDTSKTIAYTLIYDPLVPYRYISFRGSIYDAVTADKNIIVIYKEE